ncbi:MAG TPA: nucleotidyltransferase family protein [Thermoanaerobaculia bacterium]|nr:nucleotidyltransferase family protein [Thermoanaerobaculia bacterium]
MATTSKTETLPAGLAAETAAFYREAMATLEAAGVPFLVGGAYAYARYTGIVRHTKDFDVFLRPRDFDRALDALARKGWKTERTSPHWLGKAFQGDDFVDLIFSSGNGVAQVDDLWFEQAVEETILDRPAWLVPAEEMIWSKAFIMERERFDGADIAHLLHSRAGDLDWDRLLCRFEPHGGWRVLLAHLVLFGYIYPGTAQLIPGRLLTALAGRLTGDGGENAESHADERFCRGPILSRSQYLVDVVQWGYEDARLRPQGGMSSKEIAHWTTAAEKDGDTSQLAAIEGE